MTEDWDLSLNGPPSADEILNVTSEELVRALAHHGIRVTGCFGDEDGINLSLHDVRDAETMLSLVFESDQKPGSIYDRLTGGCVGLTDLADRYGIGVPPQSEVAAVFDASWTWVMHPHMEGRRVGWHITATMPLGDATYLIARLNELRNGGAL